MKYGYEISMATLALILLACVAVVIAYNLSLPYVSTDIDGNCVEVVNSDGSLGSCKAMPCKYHHQYVAPNGQ